MLQECLGPQAIRTLEGSQRGSSEDRPLLFRNQHPRCHLNHGEVREYELEYDNGIIPVTIKMRPLRSGICSISNCGFPGHVWLMRTERNEKRFMGTCEEDRLQTHVAV